MRAVLVLLAAWVSLYADQVILNNGDRITGTIVTSDEKMLVMKTVAMGEVTIDRATIASLSSSDTLTVTTTNGTRLNGRVQPNGENALVVNTEHGPVTVPYAELEAVRSPAAQAAWEREESRRANPSLTDFWSGTVGVNLANASGNATTTTLGSGATLQRITGSDKIGIAFSQIYSTQSTTAPFGTTANRIQGGVRYDRNITSKLFAFALNSYTFDEFLDLDLRVVLGGGLGYHLYKTDRSYWDVGAGADWNREAFGTGLIRNSAEALVTEESSHQLNRTLQVTQRLTVFPNLSFPGEFRIQFDAGASARLNQWLSWNVTFSDGYLSNPPPGKKKNDTILATGLGISFGQK